MTAETPAPAADSTGTVASRSSLRNVVLLSAGPVASVIVGLLAAKCWARLLGPRGLGSLALMQTFLAVGALIAGAGIATALMKSGSEALADRDFARLAALERGSRMTSWSISLFAAIVVILFRQSISEKLFQSQISGGSIALMAIAIVLVVQTSLAAAEMSLFRRTALLARVNSSSVVASTLVLISAVFIWKGDGIASGLVIGSAVGLAIAALASRTAWTEPAESWPSLSRDQVVASGKELLGIGLPYMAAALIGTAITAILPILVLHRLGAESVGYYRAGTIGSAYLELFLMAASQEFLPLIASQSRAEEVTAVGEQTTLMMSAAIPVIAGVFALADIVIPLVYSRSFSPAVPLLQWELIGDVIKTFTFPMSFAVLTLRGSPTYLAGRAASAGLTVVIAMATIGTLQLRWLGIAYVAGQVVYACILLMALRGARVRSHVPHLTTMTLTVAAMIAIQLAVPDGGIARYAASLTLAGLLTVAGTARLVPLIRAAMARGEHS